MQRRVVLASTSPRRRELLIKLAIAFDVVAPRYEEDMTLPLPPADLAMLLAAGKANSVSDEHHDALIIGADTFLELDGKLLGKPQDPSEAASMLRQISGSTHRIITGYSVLDTRSGEQDTDAVASAVRMAHIDDSDIERYVASGEPLDKAGAYALSGMGAMFVEHLDGDFSAVVGLPLRKVALSLRRYGVNVP